MNRHYRLVVILYFIIMLSGHVAIADSARIMTVNMSELIEKYIETVPFNNLIEKELAPVLNNSPFLNQTLMQKMEKKFSHEEVMRKTEKLSSEQRDKFMGKMHLEMEKMHSEMDKIGSEYTKKKDATLEKLQSIAESDIKNAINIIAKQKNAILVMNFSKVDIDFINMITQKSMNNEKKPHGLNDIRQSMPFLPPMMNMHGTNNMNMPFPGSGMMGQSLKSSSFFSAPIVYGNDITKDVIKLLQLKK